MAVSDAQFQAIRTQLEKKKASERSRFFEDSLKEIR
jgi:hypothetical protein